MKTLIAMPAMQSIPTKTVRCLTGMLRPPDTYTAISECTLVHDARNEFTSIAIQKGFDRVLWIDSDMTFPPDMLIRLSEDMDQNNLDMVCGLFFKRQTPTKPVICTALETRQDPVHGEYIHPVCYTDYPHDTLFPVRACGFGAVLTTVDLLRDVWDHYGPPFSYHLNIGEDYSFCWRVNQIGRQIWCDSRVKAGHIGQVIYGEDTYLAATQKQGTATRGMNQTCKPEDIRNTEDNA